MLIDSFGRTFPYIRLSITDVCNFKCGYCLPNGYKLDKKAEQLVNSGLTGINISIDSLDREIFKNITGHDRLPEILNGIESLQSIGFENIKINAVLLNEINSSIKVTIENFFILMK